MGICNIFFTIFASIQLSVSATIFLIRYIPQGDPGKVLVNLGQVTKDRFWWGLFLTVTSGISLALHIKTILLWPEALEPRSIFTTLVMTLAFFTGCRLISMANTTFAFCENGIYFGGLLLSWEEVESWRWSPTLPNMPIVSHKPYFFFNTWLYGWMALENTSVTIPFRCRAAVIQTLRAKLPLEGIDI